jgi:hypothetical protein
MTEEAAEKGEKLVGPMGKTSGDERAAEKPQGRAFLDVSARQGLKPDPLL